MPTGTGDDQVCGAPAMTPTFVARAAGFGFEFFLIAKLHQRVLVAAGREHHAAARAAVAAVRPAFVDKLLMPKRQLPIGAVPGPHFHRRCVLQTYTQVSVIREKLASGKEF